MSLSASFLNNCYKVNSIQITLFLCSLRLCFYLNVDYCTFLKNASAFPLNHSFSIKKRDGDFESKETDAPRWIVYITLCRFPSFPPSQFRSNASFRLGMNLLQPRHQDAVGFCRPVHLSPVSAILDVSSLQVGHLPKQNCNDTLSWPSSRWKRHSVIIMEWSAHPILTRSSIPFVRSGSSTWSLPAVSIRAGSSTCHTVWG